MSQVKGLNEKFPLSVFNAVGGTIILTFCFKRIPFTILRRRDTHFGFEASAEGGEGFVATGK